MINALLNNTMARQALRHIDLTSKYLGRYSGLAQETKYNLELLVKSFIDYVGTIFLILLLSPVLLIVALLVNLSSLRGRSSTARNEPDSMAAHPPARWSKSALPAETTFHETGSDIQSGRFPDAEMTYPLRNG